MLLLCNHFSEKKLHTFQNVVVLYFWSARCKLLALPSPDQIEFDTCGLRNFLSDIMHSGSSVLSEQWSPNADQNAKEMTKYLRPFWLDMEWRCGLFAFGLSTARKFGDSEKEEQMSSKIQKNTHHLEELILQICRKTICYWSNTENRRCQQKTKLFIRQKPVSFLIKE